MPPGWKLITENLVYQATVVQRGAQDETYIGLSAPTPHSKLELETIGNPLETSNMCFFYGDLPRYTYVLCFSF